MSEVRNEVRTEDKKVGASGITMFFKGLKNYFLQIKDAVKSVNGNEPDENGDILINSVPYAQNLESDSSQRSIGTFIARMAGGNASISDGDAWLMIIKGNNVHDGFVPESITMNVVPVERAEPITAVIDRDAFVEAVSESGTITLTYTTEWSSDPEIYGITVEGTPENGDVITVEYVKEERGTITVANPQSLISTGWNLYNHTEGYAKVLKYVNGYRIDGTYTSLQFSATIDGTKTDIVVTDGNFDIPDDGFVWVTGGNSSDTAIYATWEDWTEGYSGDFETYTASEVNLSVVMAQKFPNGLLKAGSVVDEINLNLGQAISRVEIMNYNETNLIMAKASGREFEYDEDYIYLARLSAVVSSVSINGNFMCSDHGIEFFSQTDVPVDTEVLYGNNLKNKVERNMLTISQQILTEEQKKQKQQDLGITSELSSLLVVEKIKLFDNTTIVVNGFISQEFSITPKEGYTAIGIVGVEIRNATNDGVGSSLISYNMCYLRSTTKAYVQMRNNSTNPAKLQMNVFILFVKNQ